MRLLYFFLLSFTLSFGQSPMILEGIYQNENLYIQNPFKSYGKEYCVDSVYVNGAKYPYKNESVFEIKLDTLGLKKNEKLLIELHYSKNCTPRVIHSHMGCGREKIIISLDGNSNQLLWKTEPLEAARIFIVEQKRFNKWLKVGQVDGQQLDSAYSMKIHLHSGNNTFRVKTLSYSKSPYYSNEKRIPSSTKPITFKQEGKKLIFSDSTFVQIYTNTGICLVHEPYTNEVVIPEMKGECFFLNYDNTAKQVKL